MTNYTAKYDIEEVLLHRLKQSTSVVVSPAVLDNLEVQVERVLDGLLITLSTQILAEKLPPKDISVTRQVWWWVPTSWWQMWKDEHAAKWYARWLVRRRPPEYKKGTKTVELTAMLERYWAYPEPTYLPPKMGFGRPVKVSFLNHQHGNWSGVDVGLHI